MIQTTEIARGIYRISFWEEPDLLKAGMIFPNVAYNLYLIAATKPAIVQTMFRRAFARLRGAVASIVDPSTLHYIVVPHHEGDSSGAVNEWLREAPGAVALCSDLCATLSLRDFADREPRAVADGEVLDLGSHRLRFLRTPQVDHVDSLMTYEETTRTLFPNDLFSAFGTDKTMDDAGHGQATLAAARQVGYMPDDRINIDRALDAIEKLGAERIAPMHGPTITGHFKELVRPFRECSPTHG